MGGAAAPQPPPPPHYFLDFFAEIELHPYSNHQTIMGGGSPALFYCFLLAGIGMPSCLKHFFHPVNPPATFLDLVSHDLLVMLGMLVGHAGDVENDAGDVDELV